MAAQTISYEDLEEAKSAEEQKNKVFRSLIGFNSTALAAERTWPSYDKVMTDIAAADYNHTLTCPFDVFKQDSAAPGKSLCPHGAICAVRVEFFDQPDSLLQQEGYTGLLKAGTSIEHGLLRLSSAMKPPNEAIKSTLARLVLRATGDKLRNAQLFPCAALKVFRDGMPSGNLLFGGSKIGQREVDYFEHCQCTSMTERMPRAVKPFVGKFWKYSNYPLSLGISEFCSHDTKGAAATPRANFPFALILKPCLHDDHLVDATAADASSGDNADTAFDGFLDKVMAVQTGTKLFDLYACRNPNDVPDASKLERIGSIYTTSEMLPSKANDGVFFKHQKKEDDYDLRPGWREALKATVAIDDGATKGTVGQLAGWKLFEQHIAEGSYVDFEKA